MKLSRVSKRSAKSVMGSLPIVFFLSLAAAACDEARGRADTGEAVEAAVGNTPAADSAASAAPVAPVTALEPNELGRVPILEYHLIEEGDGQWRVTPAELWQHMELLYERGYRPITVSELVDGNIDLPRGASPVVFTFDDASPSQFRYIERDGRLEIDPSSAVGVWLDFAKSHPDWGNKAVFCVLSTAQAGRAFFGDRGIEDQKSEWRFQKMKFLADQGFELCNHTLYHERLDKVDDAKAQEFIARLDMAVDSAVPGYAIRTLALPLGKWPANRASAHTGSWADPKSGNTVAYDYDAVLEVAGGPNVSPHDPKFDPKSLDRNIIWDSELTKLLDMLDKQGLRYVSDGDALKVTGK